MLRARSLKAAHLFGGRAALSTLRSGTRSASCAFALGVVLLFAGCRTRPAEPAQARRGAAAESPAPVAHWVYRPRGPEIVQARTTLGDAELVVDSGGSRWLVPKSGAPVPTAYGAPEALVAARQVGSQLAFVGESGSVYSADEALGPFVSVRAPPEVSFGAAVHGDVVLAVGRDGKLRRSADLGRSWQTVAIAGFVAAAALDEQGRALAVSVPEQWFHSTDQGASFQRIAAGTVAPERLEGGGSQIRITGWLGSYVFDGKTFVSVAASEARPRTWALPKGPSAGDIRAGHAVLESDFVALLPQGRAHELTRGALGGALEARAASGLEDCARYRLARRGSGLAVLCAPDAEGGATAPLSLYTGDAASAQFQREKVVLWGDFDRVRLALSPGGIVALTGVCAAKERDPGCTPRGVHRVRRGTTELEAVPTTFEELPQSMAFGAGDRLAIATVREKDGRALLHLWQAGQKELGQTIDLSRALDSSEAEAEIELLPSTSPWLGVVFRQQDSMHVATIDERGQIVTTGEAPTDAVAVHGAGLRFAALSPARRLFFESNDGGVTWASAALPRAVCAAERTDCSPPLVCSDAGCLVGEELTRVGWGTAVKQPLERDGAAPPAVAPAHEAGEFSCRLDADRPLELPHLVEVPGAAEAALGGTDFTVVEFDRATAALDFAWVHRGERRLQRVLGFDVVSQPERYAVAMIPQVEGAAALRYRMPLRQTGDRMISEIEVAWNNRISNVTARQRYPSLIEGKQGDYHPSATGPSEAMPELLSVAGAGVYLALHRAGSGGQPTYFFTKGGHEVLPAPRLPQALGDPGDTEYVRLGDEHAPLAFAEDRSRVFLGGVGARPEGGVALLLGDLPATVGRAQGLRLSYRGQRIGTVSMMADVDGQFWSAWFAELGGPAGEVLGEIVRVPLKADLDALPRACTSADFERTPRVVAPSFPGPSPLLRVLRGTDELGRFVLSGAVLHGTPDAPCVAAWAGSAEGPSGEGVLLLPTASGLQGWFFNARAGERSDEGYDAWPLVCAPAG